MVDSLSRVMTGHKKEGPGWKGEELENFGSQRKDVPSNFSKKVLKPMLTF